MSDRNTLANRTFTVRLAEIKAAMLFVSNDESRLVLNGVHFEAGPGRQPLLVATEGRRLAAIESAAEQTTLAEVEFTVTLTDVFLKALCAFGAKSKSLEVAFDFHPDHRIIANLVGGKCFVDCEEGAVVGGEYPTWRKVIPTGERHPIPHIGMNAEFVGDYAKAAKFLDCDAPFISVSVIGDSSAMEIKIPQRPQFYGVLMPVRVEEDQKQPEFLFNGAAQSDGVEAEDPNQPRLV